MNICSPSIPTFRNPFLRNSSKCLIKSMATIDTTKPTVRRTAAAATSALETRVSLVLAIAAQTSSLSQRCKQFLMLLFSFLLKLFGVLLVFCRLMSVLMDLATETAKYVFPNRRFESRNLEEALMSGTLEFRC